MSYKKEKIIFISHPLIQSKSDQFMIDYLSEFYELEIYRDPRHDGDYKNIPDYQTIGKKNYKAIIFWLIFPDKEITKNFSNKNIIFFPMYDFGLHLKFQDWHESCKNFKIISFSSTLHKKLKRFGLKSYYLQCFPKPEDKIYYGNEDEIFFWQKARYVDIDNILTLLPDINYKVHIHKGFDLPQELKLLAHSWKLQQNHQVTYSDWFENKKELNDLLRQKAIYVAPRSSEGLGLSFLEAMAMGKLVIANNAPTMNEYIKNGKNGFLFDNTNPQPIDLSNIKKIQENAYKYIQKGYKKWHKNRKVIIDIIEDKKKLKINYIKLTATLIFPKLEYMDPFQKKFFESRQNSELLTMDMKLKKIKNKILGIIFPSYKLLRKINNKLSEIEQKQLDVENQLFLIDKKISSELSKITKIFEENK